MTAPDQFVLPFGHASSYAAVDFVAGASNQAALIWLERTADWPARRLLLWGPAGCGKTHLLHIWANRNGAALLVGRDLRGLPPQPSAGGVAVDDADTTVDEPALLHLLNVFGEAGLPMLLAGHAPPARWPIRLPDLASRLRAVTAVEIAAPEETLLAAVLVRHLAERQLGVPAAVQTWLLHRLPRTPATVREAVARLDAAAMDRRRGITIPFARDVLRELIQPADEISEAAEAPSRDGPPIL